MTGFSLDENTNQLRYLNETLEEMKELQKASILLQCIQTRSYLLQNNITEGHNQDFLSFTTRLYNKIRETYESKSSNS